MLYLPQDMKRIGLDRARPHLSPIPASVTTLLLHKPQERDQGPGTRPEIESRWAAFSAAGYEWGSRDPWRLLDPHASPESYGVGDTAWLWTLVLHDDQFFEPSLPGLLFDCPLASFRAPDGALNCPLPPGVLPPGLSALQCHILYDQPLLPGSLPSTLTYLQLGATFNQPFLPGVLPASLVYLSLPNNHRAPLVKGTLPESLERLGLWGCSGPQDMLALPAGLKALHLGCFTHPPQPHSLPPSLQYLSFNKFDHPLTAGCLPSSLVDLDLGFNFNQPLPPGLLPPSLRRLTLGYQSGQALQAGSLPEGLLFLRFYPGWLGFVAPPFQPEVLPSTLLGIDFTSRYEHPLPAGFIPSSVRWIRLSSRYRDERIEAVLPPGAKRMWYESDYIRD